MGPGPERAPGGRPRRGRAGRRLVALRVVRPDGPSAVRRLLRRERGAADALARARCRCRAVGVGGGGAGALADARARGGGGRARRVADAQRRGGGRPLSALAHGGQLAKATRGVRRGLLAAARGAPRAGAQHLAADRQVRPGRAAACAIARAARRLAQGLLLASERDRCARRAQGGHILQGARARVRRGRRPAAHHRARLFGAGEGGPARPRAVEVALAPGDDAFANDLGDDRALVALGLLGVLRVVFGRATPEARAARGGIPLLAERR